MVQLQGEGLSNYVLNSPLSVYDYVTSFLSMGKLITIVWLFDSCKRV